MLRGHSKGIMCKVDFRATERTKREGDKGWGEKTEAAIPLTRNPVDSQRGDNLFQSKEASWSGAALSVETDAASKERSHTAGMKHINN